MPIRVSRQKLEALVVEPGEDLKVSRQIVEALVIEPGDELKVSRQYVEVLFPSTQIFEEVASSTLTLTDLAVRDVMTFNLSASSALALSQGTTRELVGRVSASSELILRQSVDYSPKFVHAVSALLLTHATSFPGTHIVSASSTLALTGTATSLGLITVDASSVLTLVQFADDETKARDINQALTLTDTATVDLIHRGFSTLELTGTARSAKELSASSQLEFTQVARAQPDRVAATTQIEFSQSARSSLKYVYASSTLELTDSNVVLKPIYVSATSPLTVNSLVWNVITDEFDLVETGLRQEATTEGILSGDASSVIGLVSFASAHVASVSGTDVSASSTISFSQHAVPDAIEESATSSLALTQSAVGLAGKPGSTPLELTQVAAFTIERGISASSPINFLQSTTFTLIIGTTTCQYSPFVGDSSDPDAPSPPPAAIDGPMAGIQVPFQFVYPSVGVVSDSVSLKTPNLGNKDRLSFHRILQETRGGTLIVYADPIWPKIQTIVMTFSGLFRVESQELLTFIDDHLGQEIGMIDWEHRYWRGVITNPDEPAIEDRFDSYTVNITFEGELDPTWNPQVVPPSLRYSAIRSDVQDGIYVPIEPQLPATPGTLDYYEAVTDSALIIGNPLYIVSGTGHVLPAQANSSTTAQVAGLSMTDTASGATCRFLTEGRIERSDWSGITGATNLSAGVFYFLDPSTAGRLTSTAPSTPGQYVVRVGRAIDTTTLDIEIELPILL
jgi:hypothetical protein